MEYYAYSGPPYDPPLQVSFTQLDLQGGDYLTIRATAPVNTLTVSGSTVPPKTFLVQNYGGLLHTEFYSDGLYEGAGYQFVASKVVPTCNGTATYNANSGTLLVPNITGLPFGFRYYPNIACTFVIQVDPGYTVGLTFNTFSTENNVDIVTVYDSDDSVLASLSGTDALPAPIGTRGNKMTITFESDDQNEYYGFNASWVAVAPVSACAAEHVITDTDSGVITSTAPYSVFQGFVTNNCSWTISNTSVADGRFAILVDYLSLPINSVVHVFDVLDNEVGQYSGVSSNNRYFVASAGMRIVWVPGDQPHRSSDGFSIRWMRVKRLGCQATNTLVTSSVGGSFSTEGASSNPGSTCTFPVQNSAGNRVRFDLPSNVVLSDGDSILLYDGPSADPLQLIGSYTTLSGQSIITTQASALAVLNVAISLPLSTINWAAVGGSQTGQCLPNHVSTATSGDMATAAPYLTNAMITGPTFSCLWVINIATTYTAVFLNIGDVFTTAGSHRLTVFDGLTTSDDVLLEYYATAPAPQRVYATSGAMTVRFMRFNATGPMSSGFQGNWNVLSSYETCSPLGLMVTNVSQFAYIPNLYDGRVLYPRNEVCTFTLSAPAGSSPLISFLNFSTEMFGDTFNVYNGNNAAPSQLLASYSGAALPAAVGALSGDMFIQFTSTAHFAYPGVKFTYQTIPTPQQCSGRTILNSTGGHFSAPTPFNLATFYTPNLDCEWLIVVPAGQAVRLSFDQYHLNSGENIFQGTTNCDGQADNITLYDGDTYNSQLILRCLTAGITTGNYYSTGNTMLVRFRTNSAGQSSGFYAIWSAVPAAIQCPNNAVQHVYIDDSTTISNPIGAGTFYPNVSCLWVIHAPANALHLDFFIYALDIPGGLVAVYEGETDMRGCADSTCSHYQNILGIQSQSLPAALQFYRVGPYSSRGQTATIVMRPSPGGNGGAGFQFFVQASNSTTVDAFMDEEFDNMTSGVLQAPYPYDGVTYTHVPGISQWLIYPDSYYNQMRFSCLNYDFSSAYALLITTFAVYQGHPSPSSLYLDASCTQPFGRLGYVYILAMQGISGAIDPSPGFKMIWEGVHVDPCQPTDYQTGSVGTVASHTNADGVTLYWPNVTCTTVIAPSIPGYQQIRFYFDWVVLTGADYVEVYEGGTVAGRPIVHYSGTAAIDGGFVSTATQLTVYFNSSVPVNFYIQAAIGFHLTWNAGVPPAQCVSLLNGVGNGDIQAPVPYDGANRNTMTACTWVITAGQGYSQVVVFFQALKIAAGAAVTLYDGPNSNTPVLLTLTQLNNNAPHLPLASTGASMLITYRTTGDDYGFWMNWTSTVQPPMCGQYNFPTDPAQGTLAYPPPWGAGFRYTSGLDCAWVLQGQPRLVFNMKQLSLQPNDVVTVYDAYHTLGPVLATFKGTPASNPTFTLPLVSSQEYLLVRLQTDILSLSDYGYSGDYAPTQSPGQCPALAELPIYNCEYSGSISAPDPYDFQTGLSKARTCVYHVHANPGTGSLSFNLNSFIPAGKSLSIYDGKWAGTEGGSSRLRLQQSGSVTTASPILNIVTGPTATIYFAGGAGSAFSLNWTAFNDTGARITQCDYIPIPTPPLMTTTADAAIPPPGASTPVTLIVGVLGGVCALVLIIVLIVLLLRFARRRRDRQENGDSTVRIDIGPEAQMKKRMNAMLKAGSTKQIGKGGTAVVFRARMEDGSMVALKQLIDSTPAARVEFHKEVTIFSRLAGRMHPNVLGLVQFCNDPPVIVCELAEKGSLHRMRKEFATMSETERKGILVQVADGMRFLHENDIVHLDLKPENVLVGEKNILKISDFGTSLILGADVAIDKDGLSVVTTSFTGTPQYSAPERFAVGVPIDLRKADVFSYGVLIWCVATGQLPFDGETGETIMSMHVQQRFDSGKSFALGPGADPMLTLLLARCLSTDFRKRPSFFDAASTIRADDPNAAPTAFYPMAGAGLSEVSLASGSSNGSSQWGDSNTLSNNASGVNTMDSLSFLQTVAPAPPPSGPVPPPANASPAPSSRGSKTAPRPPPRTSGTAATATDNPTFDSTLASDRSDAPSPAPSVSTKPAAKPAPPARPPRTGSVSANPAAGSAAGDAPRKDSGAAAVDPARKGSGTAATAAPPSGAPETPRKASGANPFAKK